MANKGIFIAENMVSTDVGAYLRSGIQSTAIENGSIVKLNGLAEGKEEVYNTIKAVVADPIYFVDGVELEYDEQLTRGLHDFENPANKPFRLRKPVIGDRFSISKNMITSFNPDTSTLVHTAADNKVVAGTTDVSASTFQAKVIGVWKLGSLGIDMVRLEVTRAV